MLGVSPTGVSEKMRGDLGTNYLPLLVRFNPEHGAEQVRERSPRGNLSIA